MVTRLPYRNFLTPQAEGRFVRLARHNTQWELDEKSLQIIQNLDTCRGAQLGNALSNTKKANQ